MNRLAPVVCALDLDAESESALVAAVELAARAGGPLHLVTARPPAGPDTYRAPSDPEAAVRAVVEVAVDRALGAGACAEIAPRIVAAREDSPADAVVSYAGEVAAGVLVVGTHGRRGVERLRLGSVAEAVVRRSPCPVLVVPNRSAGRTPGAGRPVLVPVDFSEHSARALRAGEALARLYDAPLEAMHVVDRVGRAGAKAVAAAVVLPPAAPTEAGLRAFAAEAGCEPTAVHVERGDPADSIVRLAEASDVGAVVMGTHGRSGLGHAVFGSVTASALRRLRCPVLVVRARTGQRGTEEAAIPSAARR